MSILQPPTINPLFLGLEGGATRSVAIVADAQDHLICRLEAGPANLKLLTDDQLQQHLSALAAKLPKPDAVCLGLAGLRSQPDIDRVLRAAASVWPRTPCRACADLQTAMATGADSTSRPPQTRVLILSGTGSCCYGESSDGRIAKVGGWGHLLGDKGSAYEIGHLALQECVHQLDRDGVWPKLGQNILRALQLNDAESLVGWTQQADKKDIAALAPEVFAAWSDRDGIASRILTGAAQTLARDAADCAKRLVGRRRPSVQFILAGSVLLKQPRFAQLVTRCLMTLWPTALVHSLQREGAWGAVRLAREEWSKTASSRNRAPSPSRPSRAKSGQSDHQEPMAAPLDSPIPIPLGTALSPTERRNPRSVRLHVMGLEAAVALMLDEEARVPAILARERRRIAQCIQMIVRALRSGGRLFYVGAGTSGRLGALDASECPPTFRAPPDQVQGIMAGGQSALWQSIEGAEDDATAGVEAIRFRGIQRGDVVIGIAASGRTPFVWGALHEAKCRSAGTVLVCFNPYLQMERGSEPDVLIAPNLGPEILTGSTRLKAGTATKLLLNMFSTLAMVRLGKVVSNLMVDVNPSNRKLQERAVRIVGELTGATDDEARVALEKMSWVVKEALKICKRPSERKRH